jgi:hypothetical protein
LLLRLQTATSRYHTRRQTILSVIALFIGYAVYFGVGLSNLSLPGPQYDEVADAVPAMELIHGLPNTAFDTVQVFGLRLPLVMGHYTGPSSIYVSFAGMSLFGTTVAGLRMTQLLLGAITLLLLFYLARTWFDLFTASLALLLCATAPAFLWWSRSGAHFAAPLLPLALIFLLLLRRWWQTRQAKLLVGACFVFGLGLTTKLLFAWLLVPLGLTALIVLWLPGILKVLRSIHVGTWLLCAAAFCVGFLPFIIHNVPSGASFRFIAENAIQSQTYGHNNLDIIGNVKFEVADFLRMMGGDTLHFEAPAGLPLGAIAITLSVLYTLVLCLRHRKSIPLSHNGQVPPIAHLPNHLRLRLFLLLSIVTVIPLGTISISNIGARHLFIIVPLAWLLVALCLEDSLGWLRMHWPHPAARVTSIVLVAILPLNALVTNVMIQSFMVTSGGRGLWSDALYTLANTLNTHYAGRPAMAMDWGFGASVEFLTQDKTRMKEMYEYQPEPSGKFADLATVMLRDASNVYVFHSPELTAFPGYLPAMQRQAAKQHKELVLAQTINERSGLANTLIYTAQATPRSFVVSPTLATRNAVFSGGLTLLGGTAQYDAAQHEIAVQLYWQNNATGQPDDTVLMHVVNQSTGEVVVNADQQPLYGSYPFSQWQKGEVVTDQRWISLPGDIKPGVYQVRVGVYDTKTGTRRSIDDPQHDSAGNSLMLHFFEIK